MRLLMAAELLVSGPVSDLVLCHHLGRDMDWQGLDLDLCACPCGDETGVV